MNRESSSLSPPTVYVRGCANMREWLSGRASPCQGESRGFDPRLPLQVCLSIGDYACQEDHCPIVSTGTGMWHASRPALGAQLGTLAPQYFPIEACLGYNQGIECNVGDTFIVRDRYSARYMCWRKSEGLG